MTCGQFRFVFIRRVDLRPSEVVYRLVEFGASLGARYGVAAPRSIVAPASHDPGHVLKEFRVVGLRVVGSGLGLRLGGGSRGDGRRRGNDFELGFRIENSRRNFRRRNFRWIFGRRR